MNLIDAAENLKLAGLNPLPLKQDKSPKLAAGHPYLYKEVPDHLIEKLFTNAPKIGVACGDVSDGFYCLDFDCHDGENITLIFDRFCEDPYISELIQTRQVGIYQSPSGGYHLYFKSDLTMKGTDLAHHADTGGVAIELRGNGQYMVTAPSQGYTKIAGCSLLDVERFDDSQTNYLLDLARSFNATKKTTTKAKDPNEPDRKWPDKWDVSTPKGKFNEDNIDNVPQWLQDAGWKLKHIRESDQVQYWQRPGKAPDDRTNSATYGAQRGMFYVFSTDGNIVPFEQGRGYSPFDVWTNTVHKGDWKAALNEIDPKPEPPERPKVADPGAFPIDVFPQGIQELIQALEEGADYSPDFVAIAIITAYATCNGNKIKLKIKNNYFATTIFWSMAVGAPGTKKTHPISTILTPLLKKNIDNKKQYDQELQEWEQTDKKGNRPKFYQYVVQDFTIEALHMVHTINKKGVCLYKDEIKSFFGDMNRYKQGGKGSDEQFWLESHSNKGFTINRVSREAIVLENINIQLIGTIQPDVLEDIVSGYSGNGLIDRFLFTRAETKVKPMSSKDVEQRYLDLWHDNINSILNNRQMDYFDEDDTVIIEMPPEAYNHFLVFEHELTAVQNDENESSQIKNYISKLKTYYARFVLLVALMDMFTEGVELEINTETIDRAVRLTRYFLSTARAIFSDTDESSEMKRIMRANQSKSKAELIELLSSKGFKNADIARNCKCSKAYVGKVLTKVNKEK